MKHFADEVKLFNRLKKGDETAREEIFKAHQAMVAKIAWGYSRKSSLSVKEMMAEGYVGLLQAIEKFNLAKAKRKKVKFSSYAFWWIRRYIIRALIKEQSVLSVPESVSELTHRYNHFAGVLTQTLGREPTEMEVKKLLTLSEQQMERVIQRRAVTEVSLDDRIFIEDENRTLADVIPGEYSEDIEKTLERGALIEKYFSVLTPQEKMVLNFRFGLQKQPQLNYREIAEKLAEKFKKKLSRQRVQQICQTALYKIKTVHEKEVSDGRKKPGKVD